MCIADVLEGIASCAFESNDAPVILSFENHCDMDQQRVMAEIIRHVFVGGIDQEIGLLQFPSYDLEKKLKHLPSPLEMRRKIIIKGKRPPLFSELSSVSGVEEDDEEDEEGELDESASKSLASSTLRGHIEKVPKHAMPKKKKKSSTHRELQMLTFLGAEHAPKKFVDPDRKLPIPCDMMSSYGENKTLKHLANPKSSADWIVHNMEHLRYCIMIKVLHLGDL